MAIFLVATMLHLRLLVSPSLHQFSCIHALLLFVLNCKTVKSQPQTYKNYQWVAMLQRLSFPLILVKYYYQCEEFANPLHYQNKSCHLSYNYLDFFNVIGLYSIWGIGSKYV